VKEMAMQATPDVDGDYINTMIFNENGTEIIYGFIYSPGQKIILLGSSGLGLIIYDEVTGEFSTIYNNFLIPIDKDIAITEAYKIFRELIKKNMI
jgi:hypothetical protein